jgi:hypothetical protein
VIPSDEAINNPELSYSTSDDGKGAIKKKK